MDKELLGWIGNAINFLILVYLSVNSFIVGKFDLTESMIGAFGLFISIIIHLYNLLTNKDGN